MSTATEYEIIEGVWNQIPSSITAQVAQGWKVIGFSVDGGHAFVLLERSK